MSFKLIELKDKFGTKLFLSSLESYPLGNKGDREGFLNRSLVFMANNICNFFTNANVSNLIKNIYTENANMPEIDITCHFKSEHNAAITVLKDINLNNSSKKDRIQKFSFGNVMSKNIAFTSNIDASKNKTIVLIHMPPLLQPHLLKENHYSNIQ